jgi:competence ComEA-like helix-hairpin-helix protein
MEKGILRPIGNMMLAFALMYGSVLPVQAQGTTATKTEAKTQSQPAGKTPVLKGKTVNINKANEAELVKNIPLITPALAKEIVKYRKDNGDFQTLEELLQIEGFNRELLRKIKSFLLLEGIGGKDCTC